MVEVFDDSTSSEDDVSALDSSDECDNEPLHGTLQKPNLKTKKKPPARQIKGRKVKHDMVTFLKKMELKTKQEGPKLLPPKKLEHFLSFFQGFYQQNLYLQCSLS